MSKISFVKYIVLLGGIVLFPRMAYCNQSDSISKDNLKSDSVKSRSIIKKFLTYLEKSDKPNPNKKIDFGILGGPHYSSDSGFGLGLVASGLYSTDRRDSLLPQSNISLFGDITTKGFLMIGLRGNNIFPQRKYRLDYKLYLYTFPSNFWGMGYDNGDIDDNKSKYNRFKCEVMGRFLFRLTKNSFIGPVIDFQFVRASKIDEKAEPLFAGQYYTVRNLNMGFSYTYDSRDFILNARRGWFVQFDQLFTPKILCNDYGFITTELAVSTYREVWKGGVLAGEIHSKLNFGDVPWPMMSEVGTSNRMRGYYDGRYRDKNIVEGQLELRQKIWKRHGMAAWVGLANVFPKFSEMRLKKTLPNAGIGYRWEFKKRVNVRLDYGFTRNGSGFLFNITEAF